MRIGIGYDVHRLEKGRRLVLGGVEIPSPVGLAGHSDADALLHAIADAILGAAALGDIGDHFPNNDSRWCNADSGEILQAVLTMAEAHHFQVCNVDVNVVAEWPKLGPIKDQIRANVASLLGLPADRVSIKARTAEGLGPIGRREAIEVHAAVLMEEIPQP